MEFPPTLPDFPQQKTKHVSFRSPDPAFKSPPFSDFNEFEQLDEYFWPPTVYVNVVCFQYKQIQN
jgi:hypothetical protein